MALACLPFEMREMFVSQQLEGISLPLFWTSHSRKLLLPVFIRWNAHLVNRMIKGLTTSELQHTKQHYDLDLSASGLSLFDSTIKKKKEPEWLYTHGKTPCFFNSPQDCSWSVKGSRWGFSLSARRAFFSYETPHLPPSIFFCSIHSLGTNRHLGASRPGVPLLAERNWQL